jgi:hypothetical protein
MVNDRVVGAQLAERLRVPTLKPGDEFRGGLTLQQVTTSYPGLFQRSSGTSSVSTS